MCRATLCYVLLAVLSAAIAKNRCWPRTFQGKFVFSVEISTNKYKMVEYGFAYDYVNRVYMMRDLTGDEHVVLRENGTSYVYREGKCHKGTDPVNVKPRCRYEGYTYVNSDHLGIGNNRLEFHSYKLSIKGDSDLTVLTEHVDSETMVPITSKYGNEEYSDHVMSLKIKLDADIFDPPSQCNTYVLANQRQINDVLKSATFINRKLTMF